MSSAFPGNARRSRGGAEVAPDAGNARAHDVEVAADDADAEGTANTADATNATDENDATSSRCRAATPHGMGSTPSTGAAAATGPRILAPPRVGRSGWCSSTI